MSKILESPEYRAILERDRDEYNSFPMARYFDCGSSEPPKCVQEFRRWSSIVDVSSHHIRFHRNPTRHPDPKTDTIAKRGAIRGFSRHSRLRLRDSLASAFLESSDTFGITLTVPWKETPCGASSCVLRLYRECFNRFTVSFKRRFPFSACIFRHELQRRKMPHCHLVFFMASADQKEGEGIAGVRKEVFSLWLRALNGFLGGGSLLAFSRHGVKVDYLGNQDAMFRYICDHTSKSKQAQLGYKGKQWGYINRKVLSKRVQIRYQFRAQHDMYFFQRHISKACRFFISAPCVFGRKLSDDLNGVSIQFVKGSTVRKLVRYIDRHSMGVLRLRFDRLDRQLAKQHFDFSLFSVSSPLICLWYNLTKGKPCYVKSSVRRVYLDF